MQGTFERIVARLEVGGEGPGLFYARLGRVWETIEQNLARLYGSRPDKDELLERLAALLARKFSEREGHLKKRDRASAEGGPWYLEPGLAAYMLYVDRFAHDFAGLEKRLPWLESLGMGLVHLMPFTRTREGNNDGGYAVSDYLEIDPRLGTVQDLIDTARLFHDRNLHLAADLVLNHSADDHPWALAAKKGDRRYRDYYYVFPDRVEPDLYEARLPEIFPATAPGNFTWNEEMKAWVMTVFHDFQWDLNWRNPEVLLEMLAILLEMANRGIDLIRLDAVPYLWKIPGTNCQNLEEAHLIVRLLKAAAGVVAPSLAFLAEAIVQPSEIVKYLDREDKDGQIGLRECQLAYHASLMALLWEALATRKTSLLAASFAAEARLAGGTAWLTYARCHDDFGLGFDDALIAQAGYDPGLHRRFLVDWYTGRFPGSLASGRPFMEDPRTGEARISGTCASLSGLELALKARDPKQIDLALRRIELLHALIASLVGIPMIFSGDELATINDYSWEDSEDQAGDNRWMHRPRLDWTLAEARRGTGTQVEAARAAARIRGFIAVCLERRRDIPALAQDSSFEVLPAGQHSLVVRRRSTGRAALELLVVANFLDEEAQVEVGADCFGLGAEPMDLLGSRRAPTRVGKLHLAPYEVLWLSPS